MLAGGPEQVKRKNDQSAVFRLVVKLQHEGALLVASSARRPFFTLCFAYTLLFCIHLCENNASCNCFRRLKNNGVLSWRAKPSLFEKV